MRPRLTEIDYAIIAVSPALIMLLVGSLVLFLTELVYEGPHALRLNFILCMFVLGIVSIARISIEQGAIRAVPFGVVLGGLVAFAVARFVPEALVLTCVLLAVVWWASTRLVYDCTVVDQSVDASKKGLMQWIRSADQNHAEPFFESGGPGPPHGVTGREGRESSSRRGGWISAWINPTSTQFAPGVWVVYFSLAALPIFGLGQAFAGPRAQDDKWYLFVLLVVYVAAALSLMVTTSFLGLRRYLQQRGIPMPLSMTGVWLGVGLSVVALVLLTVSVLPRPNAEYELARLPHYHDQESRQASRVAVGQDGTRDKWTDHEGTNPDLEKADNQQPPSSENRSDNQEAHEDADTGEVAASDEPFEAGDQPSGNSQPGDSESPNGEVRNGQQDESAEASESTSSQQVSGQGGANHFDSSDDESPNSNRASQEEAEASTSNEPNAGPRESTDAVSPPPEGRQASASDSALGSLFSSLGNLLKILLYTVIAGLVLFLLWCFRGEMARSWSEFWANLFGRKQKVRSETPGTQMKSVHDRTTFSAFVNPFQDPSWKGRPLEDWIRYSFSAIEAWAEERGHGRKDEQTPTEFASMLERQYVDFHNSVRQAADLYGQVAYGSGKAPGETVEILRNLWQRLRAL